MNESETEKKMDIAELLAKTLELFEQTDPMYGNGEMPGGWLSYEPDISDAQLELFESALLGGIQFVRENVPCGHETCAVRALCEMPMFRDMVPPTTVFVIIRELLMHRALTKMQTGELTFPDSLEGM